MKKNMSDESIQQLQQQLVELQMQLSFQEDTVQALNDVITRQQQQIENLYEQFNNQKLQLDQINNDMDKGSNEERPPHY